VVGQLDTDAVIMAFHNWESVIGFEEVALQAWCRVKLSLGQLLHEDRLGSELDSRVDDWDVCAENNGVFLIAVFRVVVSVAAIVRVEGGRARWRTLGRLLLATADNDTVCDVHVFEGAIVFLTIVGLVQSMRTRPNSYVFFFIVCSIDRAIAELGLNLRST